MALPTFEAEAISPQTRTEDIGVVIKSGGIITNDAILTQYFKLLHIGTGGNLLVRGIDGNIIPFFGLLSGDWVPVLGNQVVSAATIDGSPYTTTATDVTWHGGI